MTTEFLKNTIQELRQRIEDHHQEYNVEYGTQLIFERIDDFLNFEPRSDLEKAFFLILHHFAGDNRSYIIRPSEMVLIPDIYDISCPGIEYEIDFALYGGSLDNPVKVAIECDGIRSHREKHKNKDRRKDVNLQAAGWIVMRFGSKEIIEELKKYEADSTYTSYFLNVVENTIQQKLKVIDNRTYAFNEYRSKLTGYKWGFVDCTHCGNHQMDTLNHMTIKCRKCQQKFKRDIKVDEKIKYEMNGLIYFND